MDLKQFKTDPAKQADGVWQPIGEGTEFLIARMGNPACKAAFKKYAGRYKGAALDMLPTKKQDEIFAKVMAETVLIDWRETVDGKVRAHTVTLDGKRVTYSAEAAMALLSDPDYLDLLSIVRIYADDAEAYREDAIKEDSGNSPSASDG
jgi:hypothetical protein